MLQWVDAGQVRAQTEDQVRDGGKLSAPPDPWASIIRLHRRVVFVPAFSCNIVRDADVIIELTYDASLSATPTSSIYLARRQRIEPCGDPTEQPVGPDDLLVIVMPPVTESAVLARPDATALCRRFIRGFACTRHWDEIDAAALGRDFQKVMP
jgi:hypothetical protein